MAAVAQGSGCTRTGTDPRWGETEGVGQKREVGEESAIHSCRGTEDASVSRAEEEKGRKRGKERVTRGEVANENEEEKKQKKKEGTLKRGSAGWLETLKSYRGAGPR
jgi:hypothetical protein